MLVIQEFIFSNGESHTVLHTWLSRSRNYRYRSRIWCFCPLLMVLVQIWYRWLWFSKYRSRTDIGDFYFPKYRSRLVSLIDDCISNKSLAPSRGKIIISCLVCDWTTAKTSHSYHWSVCNLPASSAVQQYSNRYSWERLAVSPAPCSVKHQSGSH